MLVPTTGNPSTLTVTLQAMWRNPITEKQIRVLEEDWGVRADESAAGATRAITGWFKVLTVSISPKPYQQRFTNLPQPISKYVHSSLAANSLPAAWSLTDVAQQDARMWRHRRYVFQAHQPLFTKFF